MAAKAVNSPYFDYENYDGPEDKLYEWMDNLSDELQLLRNALHDPKVKNYGDLPPDAKKVFDKAMKAMTDKDNPPMKEGESNEQYDMRRRMTDESSFRLVSAKSPGK